MDEPMRHFHNDALWLTGDVVVLSLHCGTQSSTYHLTHHQLLKTLLHNLDIKFEKHQTLQQPASEFD